MSILFNGSCEITNCGLIEGVSSCDACGRKYCPEHMGRHIGKCRRFNELKRPRTEDEKVADAIAKGSWARGSRRLCSCRHAEGTHFLPGEACSNPSCDCMKFVPRSTRGM